MTPTEELVWKVWLEEESKRGAYLTVGTLAEKVSRRTGVTTGRVNQIWLKAKRDYRNYPVASETEVIQTFGGEAFQVDPGDTPFAMPEVHSGYPLDKDELEATRRAARGEAFGVKPDDPLPTENDPPSPSDDRPQEEARKIVQWAASVIPAELIGWERDVLHALCVLAAFDLSDDKGAKRT
jgi:hypothetical protein